MNASDSNAQLDEYFRKHEPSFVQLQSSRQQGWANPDADAHFAVRQETVQSPPDDAAKFKIFARASRIGDELNRKTKCFEIKLQHSPEQLLIGGTPPAILDLCMATGGFASTALKASPGAVLRSVTLSPELGGHSVYLSPAEYPNNIHIEYEDVTMLAGEMGIQPAQVPDGHPTFNNLVFGRLFADVEAFDLVICGGAPLRSNTQLQGTYRHAADALRLALSQLVVALNRVKEGGTMVMLLHRAESWATVQIMFMLSEISRLRVFKPRSAQRTKSGFYLVATDVEPNARAAAEAVRRLQTYWRRLTLAGPEGSKDLSAADLENADFVGVPVGEVVRRFGPQLRGLVRTVWLEQDYALRNPPWEKKREDKGAGAAASEQKGGEERGVGGAAAEGGGEGEEKLVDLD